MTDIPKYWPAQVPASDDHELPLLDDDSAVNVGVGLTLVDGVAELHFQPMVPPAEPVRTTKYWVLAASVRGVANVYDGAPSDHPPGVTDVATAANCVPGAPLTLDQILSE